MERMVKRKYAISYIIVAVAVLLFVLVWPLKIIRYGYTARSGEIMARESDPVSVEYNITQMFEGIGGELKSVDIYVCNDMAGQIMTFRMYDENHEQIFERFVSVSEDFISPGFINIPVRYDMEDKKEYSFIIEGLTTELYVAYEDRDSSTSPVNYFMAYGGAEVPEYDVIVRYNYSRSFLWWQLVLIAVALGVACLFAVRCLIKSKNEAKIKVRYLAQIICNPILILAAFFSFYLIMIRKLFGIDTKNNAFLVLGCWMLIAFLGYVVNVGEVRIEKNIRSLTGYSQVMHFIRIISIATVLWYCYEYMNGLYDIFHYYSISKLVIAFSFLLISTFDKKEMFNVINAVWIVVGPVLGYIYYRPQRDVEEWGELYRLNGWVIVVGGFVLINIVCTLVLVVQKKKKFPCVNKWFAVPVTVLLIGMCVLSNGRYWPYLLTGICLLLAFRLAFIEDKRLFTKELCAGIILNFYMMVFFSLRHRPYYFYQYYRYNMGYHTVTVTAYYLAMIVCAAWMRLYASIRNSDSIKSVYHKMFTFGMSMTYLIFTMSRTGFLSVGIMLMFSFALAVLTVDKKIRIRHGLRQLLIACIAIMYLFPVTFFLTDIVPRVANDPVVFEYEVRDFTFKKGMPYADANYMTIEQFVSEFGRKVLNIDPDEKEAWIRDPFLMEVYAAQDEEEYTDNTPEQADEEDVTDMSNGRFDIFKSYISVWNLRGHEEMGTLLPNGETAVHAHNSFLQVAHDHGIIVGIYFVLFIGYVVILSLGRFIRKREDDIYTMFCPIVLVCFIMASLVEWLLHPCNPFGLTIFLAMMPLFYKDIEDEKGN